MVHFGLFQIVMLKNVYNIYYDLLYQVNTTVEGYGRCVDHYPMHFCTYGYSL